MLQEVLDGGDLGVFSRQFALEKLQLPNAMPMGVDSRTRLTNCMIDFRAFCATLSLGFGLQSHRIRNLAHRAHRDCEVQNGALVLGVAAPDVRLEDAHGFLQQRARLFVFSELAERVSDASHCLGESQRTLGVQRAATKSEHALVEPDRLIVPLLDAKRKPRTSQRRQKRLEALSESARQMPSMSAARLFFALRGR